MAADPDAGEVIERGDEYGDSAGYVDRRCGTERTPPNLVVALPTAILYDDMAVIRHTI